MKNIFYAIAIILFFGWFLGVFVYSFTGFIHLHLVLVIILLGFTFVKKKKNLTLKNSFEVF